MFATELEVGEASHDHHAVRWQLFCFREIRDVLPGSRRGTVVVIHIGAARPTAWRAEVLGAGESGDARHRPAG